MQCHHHRHRHHSPKGRYAHTNIATSSARSCAKYKGQGCEEALSEGLPPGNKDKDHQAKEDYKLEADFILGVEKVDGPLLDKLIHFLHQIQITSSHLPHCASLKPRVFLATMGRVELQITNLGLINDGVLVVSPEAARNGAGQNERSWGWRNERHY